MYSLCGLSEVGWQAAQKGWLIPITPAQPTLAQLIEKGVQPCLVILDGCLCAVEVHQQAQLIFKCEEPVRQGKDVGHQATQHPHGCHSLLHLHASCKMRRYQVEKERL